MPAKSPLSSSISAAQLAALGKRIREQRKALRVSTVAAAEAAGLSRVTLHRIEHGEPSVTMGAYLNAMTALGLGFECLPLEAASEVVRPGTATRKATGLANAPLRIRVADYPQLQRVAWHLGDSILLTEQEALELYERNWRHVEVDAMPSRERELLDRLVQAQGKGRLLV